MTISDGWVYHVEPYATPPTLTTANYFGYIPQDHRGIINAPVNNNIEQITTYGTYTPTLDATSILADQVSVNFTPVNGCFLYWMCGKVSDAGGTKTITAMDGTARKPRLGLWQQTDNKKYHHYGAVFGNLDMEFNTDAGLVASLVGKGLDHGTDSNSPTLSFPSSIKSAFTHFNTMTWNSNALHPQRFKMTLQQDLKGWIDNDGIYYQDVNEFAPIFGSYSVQFTSTDGETIYDDYIAQTARTFVWKICKADATKYIQCSSTAMMVSLIPTRIYDESTIWTASMVIQAPTFTVVDGVANSFYQIA